MGKIRAVCISREKGTAKQEQKEAVLVADWGLDGDAHAGAWHRQVSLLEAEKVDAFRNRGADVGNGDFGENLLVEGLELQKLPVGSHIHIGEAVLELTQKGKECHSHCAIYRQVGDCIMPREGVFARVLKGGRVSPGDRIFAENPPADRAFTAAVITMSDKGSRGEREDLSGPLAVEMLRQAGYRVEEAILLPDEKGRLVKQLCRLADQREISLILTLGGTGFSVRDVTPEATEAVCDRMADGIAEAIRGYSMTITKRAMLSRAKAGIRARTLIVNLPGSPRAVRESLEFVLPQLGHGLGVLRGTEGECAR